MREDPNGAALLRAASTLLRDEVIKALPDDQRHAALMIANAMSIALRQLEHGAAPEEDELRALRELLGGADGQRGATMRAMLVALNRQLAQRIRAGATDPGTALHGAALAHLRQAGRQRLLESNPKILKLPS